MPLLEVKNTGRAQGLGQWEGIVNTLTSHMLALRWQGRSLGVIGMLEVS